MLVVLKAKLMAAFLSMSLVTHTLLSSVQSVFQKKKIMCLNIIRGFLFSGTSNWSGDYFVNTAGSALVVNQTASQSVESTVQSQLKAVFERDWNSGYSTPLTQHSNLKDFCYF